MKMIVAAIAIAFACPAAAQTAAPAGPSQHQQHQHHQPVQHPPGQHDQHRPGEPAKGHSQGEQAECCCCGKMAESGKMKGCEADGPHGQSQQPSGHQMQH